MSFPLTLTPQAIERLRGLLARNGVSGSFVRVGVKGGGCSGFEYVLKLDDRVREDDFILELDGLQVRCDPKSAPYLEDSTLDISNNLVGGAFMFKNPNAQRSCGCGTSFTPKAIPSPPGTSTV